jgi:peptide/nickel transport system permease protein
MKAYVTRRLILLIPVLVGVSFMAFMILQLVPGDVCTIILARSASGTEEELQRCRQDLGLDSPAYRQYIDWVGRLVRGDLGVSFWTHRPIAEELGKRIPVTLELALLAIVISTTVGVSLGLLSATRQDSVRDYGGRMFAIIGLSIPDFVIGTVFLLFLVTRFEWVPPITYKRLIEDPWGNVQQFIFPALLLGFGLSASIARMTRSTMLEVLRQDYIRTAWAKGLRGRTVILKHALRNAMIPVVTIIGLQFGGLLGGTVVMEVLFGMPGLGRTMVDAIIQRDYPFMQSIVLVTSLAYVVVNLVVDLSYGVFDPRVRYS